MHILGTIKEIALTTSSGAAYTSGDQIDVAKEITDISDSHKNCVLLESLMVLDKDKQKQSMDLLFFDENPTNAVADNAAADISDAELLDKCIGHVNVPAANYVDLANASIATVSNIQLMLKVGAVRSKSIFMLAVSRGTPTFTSTAGLAIKLGVRQF